MRFVARPAAPSHPVTGRKGLPYDPIQRRGEQAGGERPTPRASRPAHLEERDLR
jgi:hypothetical protein